MPYEPIYPAFMLAIGIWLLAILVFAAMLLIVIGKIISENWNQGDYVTKQRTQTAGRYPFRRKKNLPPEQGY